MVLDVMNISSLIKTNSIGSNCIILSNGTCIVTKSNEIHNMLEEVNASLSKFEPGMIDFKSKPLNKNNSLVSYNVDNVFNFVNSSSIKNKSNTFIAILGRNQLLKDLVSPSVYAIMLDYELIDDINEYRLQRFREF